MSLFHINMSFFIIYAHYWNENLSHVMQNKWMIIGYDLWEVKIKQKVKTCSLYITSLSSFFESFAHSSLSSLRRLKSLFSMWSLSMVHGRSFALNPTVLGKGSRFPVSTSSNQHCGHTYSASPPGSLLSLYRAHIWCCQRWHLSHSTHYKNTTIGRFRK